MTRCEGSNALSHSYLSTRIQSQISFGVAISLRYETCRVESVQEQTSLRGPECYFNSSLIWLFLCLHRRLDFARRFLHFEFTFRQQQTNTQQLTRRILRKALPYLVGRIEAPPPDFFSSIWIIVLLPYDGPLSSKSPL